jgi:O-antigen/teichoic acid export membrane protein
MPTTLNTSAVRDNPHEGAGKPSILKRLFISTGKVSFYQGLGLLLGFGLQVFISHTCGATGMGGYTLFISWLAMLSVLTVPGMEGALVYFLPRFERDIDSRRKVLRVCLSTIAVTSLLSAAVVLAAADRILLLIGLPSGTSRAFAIAIIFFSVGKLLDAVFLGMKDAQLIGYFNVIRTILRFIFCLPILLYPKASWTILFYGVACECVVTVGLRFGSLRRRYPNLLKIDRGLKTKSELRAKEVFAISVPMCGINVIEVAYPCLDKAILGFMVPLALVGIYKASESIASLNSLFVSPFVAFWPYISKLFAENRLDELRNAYQNVTLVIIALMIPFSLALVELSGVALSIFGHSFVVQGTTVLLVLAFGSAIDAIAGPAGAVLRMTKHSRIALVINVTLIIVYCGLALVLTKEYGVLGAAVARTVTVVLGNVVNVTANHLLIGIFPYTIKHAWLLGCGVSILAIRTFSPTLAIGVGGHCIVALVEVTAFVLCAALTLRVELKQIMEKARNLLTA